MSRSPTQVTGLQPKPSRPTSPTRSPASPGSMLAAAGCRIKGAARMSNRTESYLVGLVGDGVMPSLTPPMHEREGDVQGLRYLYRPIDLLELNLPAESVGKLLESARSLGFNGLNITHPCKQLVLQHLDEVSADAQRLGAVNTVVIENGRFVGHNTDFSGFAAALASGLPAAKLERVVQL